jgi:hypothetical protein
MSFYVHDTTFDIGKIECYEDGSVDALANTHGMAKQKLRPTRLGVFSGAKA